MKSAIDRDIAAGGQVDSAMNSLDDLCIAGRDDGIVDEKEDIDKRLISNVGRLGSDGGKFLALKSKRDRRNALDNLSCTIMDKRSLNLNRTAIEDRLSKAGLRHACPQ